MSEWTDHLDPDRPDGAYLPWKKVEARVGISRTTAWRLQKTGDFPKPYVISPGRVGYRESEIEAWKASRGHRAAVDQRALGQPLAKPSPRADPVPDERASWPSRPDPANPPLEPPTPAEAEMQPGRPTRQRMKRSSGNQMTFDF